LSRFAQALGVRFLLGVQAGWLRAASLVCVLLALPACASGGFSLEKAEVDSSLYTGNIPAGRKDARAAERVSDEATIRNAVSSADIESLAGRSVPWVNSDTGSRGLIDNLAEFKSEGLLCRRFNTSRESFDGVALFKGEACMVSAGAWRMQSFEGV
jgi:hypothetical protein